MLPTYNLVVDIIATEKNLSEKKFREQVAPSLAYLEALKGSFDRVPCSIKYYPPDEQNGNDESEFWMVRAFVMISLGKQRGEYLYNLYKAIVRLIEYELPDYLIDVETSVFDFDDPL